jgi:heme-degrading monooxygenase HmoA
MNLQELDEYVSIHDQLAADIEPVILINVFTVNPSESDALMRAWADDAAIMKTRPGFISTQLHRGIGGSGVFLNYAVWESVRDFRNAFTAPEFRNSLAAYPASTVARPHLFARIAVPGICIGC